MLLSISCNLYMPAAPPPAARAPCRRRHPPRAATPAPDLLLLPTTCRRHPPQEPGLLQPPMLAANAHRAVPACLYEQRDGPHTLGTLTLRSRVSTAMSNCKWARGASSWVSKVRAVAHPFIVVSTSLTNGSSLPTDYVTTTALTRKLTKCVLCFCNPRVTAVPSPHCSPSERATASSQTQTVSASAGVTLTRLAVTRSRSRTRCPPNSGSPCSHSRRCHCRTSPSDTSPSTPPPSRRPLKGRARLLVPGR